MRFLSLVLLFALFSLSSCTWLGRTTGETQADIENTVKDTKEAYKEGYHRVKE